MESIIHCPRCEQEVAASDAACPACGHIHGEKLACARHTDRTADGICVVCGDPACDECNSGDRLHFACPDHRAVPVIQGWAQIYSTNDTFEADLIKENLRSEGLDAMIFDQKDRSFSFDLGDLSPVRVLVPAYEYMNAMALLAGHMDAQGEVSFACPACGEAYDAGAAACGSCGAQLPTARAQRPFDAE